jgi:deazaflavin-dependent oxidoreductase (nitroreductase family)
MAYLRPPLFQRAVFNKLAMRFGIGGAATLATKGRKTGESRTIPVVVFENGGDTILVSPRGDAHWVKNMRADGGRCQVKRKGGQFVAMVGTEVPPGERAPLLEEYKKVAGGAVKGYFAKLPDPSDHPIFRLRPQ